MYENWVYSMLLLLLINLTVPVGKVNCQKNDGPIGAHRVYRKTSFSCHGRSTGYYADVETGCQVYHMCDGLGRQFSYSCPNTTLFQQRMLICDHWYMVNCSRAESDYDANLLIGQRDKPFVSDDVENFRTPRPDLLDRPYAPDYSGESFRHQYEQIPQVPNNIDDASQYEDTEAKQQLLLNPPPSSTRWRISVPSQDILPPSASFNTIRRMDQIDDGNPDLGTSFSTRYNTSEDLSSEEEKLPVSQQLLQTTTLPTTQTTFGARKTVYKTSSKPTTVYRTETKNKLTTTTPLTSNSSLFTQQPISNSIINSDIKAPSRLYEPPFLYPIWNENYTASNEDNYEQKFPTTATTTTTTIRPQTTKQQFRIISTSAPFSATTSRTSLSSRPATRPLTKPTTSSGKPFTSKFKPSITTTSPESNTDSNLLQNSFETLQQSESSNRGPSSLNNYDFSRYFIKSSTAKSKTGDKTEQLNDRKNSNSNLLQQKPIVVVSQTDDDSSSSFEHHGTHESSFEHNIPKSQNLNTPTPFSKATQKNLQSSSFPLTTPSTTTSKSSIPTPPRDLVPPFPDYIQHDIATTQGPPIYFEWKIPSNALEPPKLDPPIGVDGRLPDYEIEYKKKFNTNSSSFKLNEQQLPFEEQQLPVEDSSKVFTSDDTHALQNSQLDQGAFGKKLRPLNNPPQIPSTNLQPPNSDNDGFIQDTNKLITQFPFSNNPFLSTLAVKNQRSVNTSTRHPTSSPRPFSTNNNKRELVSRNQNNKKPATEQQIQQLKKDLSIPDYLFPLENGRTGYDFSESKNSFQLKIPKRSSDDKGKWYGENPKCPECHPSFAKPGSCEPCVRRR